MNKSEAFQLSLTILIPTIIGLVRFRHIPASYRPLIYLLCIGVANELICYFFFYNTSNAVPTNIYFLCEFLLLTLQFRIWRNIMKRTWIYNALIIFMVCLWVIENIVLGKITVFSPLFQVSFSFVLILIAVNQLNWLIVNAKDSIATNPAFIISIAIIIFFSYKMLTEIFYYYAPQALIKNHIFVIEVFLNVIYNIIFAIALLCIPRKRDFIQLLQ